MKHYLYKGMKVRHLAQKIAKICNQSVTGLNLEVFYIESESKLEIIDDKLLKMESELDFLMNQDHLYAVLKHKHSGSTDTNCYNDVGLLSKDDAP